MTTIYNKAHHITRHSSDIVVWNNQNSYLINEEQGQFVAVVNQFVAVIAVTVFGLLFLLLQFRTVIKCSFSFYIFSEIIQSGLPLFHGKFIHRSLWSITFKLTVYRFLINAMIFVQTYFFDYSCQLVCLTCCHGMFCQNSQATFTLETLYSVIVDIGPGPHFLRLFLRHSVCLKISAK